MTPSDLFSSFSAVHDLIIIVIIIIIITGVITHDIKLESDDDHNDNIKTSSNASDVNCLTMQVMHSVNAKEAF